MRTPNGTLKLRTDGKYQSCWTYPNLLIDWKKLYSLAFETTLDTNLREFKYKILNLIIFTNEKLHRFKMVDSPLCAFCNAEVESLKHLLYFCKSSSVFWKKLLSWIAVDANMLMFHF